MIDRLAGPEGDAAPGTGPASASAGCFRPRQYAYLRGVGSFIVGLAGLTARGFGMLPRQGPAMLAPNHTSWRDVPALAAACRRPVRFAASPHLYDTDSCICMLRRAAGRMGGGRAAARLLALFERELAGFLRRRTVECGAFPAALGRGFIGALTAAADRGDLVCIFPEGLLSPGRGLNRLRRGLAMGAAAVCSSLGCDVPVYPVAVSQGPGVPLLGREISMEVGEPLFYSEVAGSLDLPEGTRRFTARVGGEIARLLG